MGACDHGHTDVVHALLSGGARVDLQDEVSTAHIEMPTLLQPCNLASQFKHSQVMQRHISLCT